MGLNKKNTNVLYLSINKGMLVMRVKEATETSVSRELEKGENSGNTVHEELYDSLEGQIIGLYKKESKVPWQKELQETLEIILKDDDMTYQVSMNFSSSYTRGLMTRIEAIDLGQPCEISTYWIKGDDQKERGFVGIKQFGEKIEAAYSKDLKNLPEVKAVKVGKNTHYDDEELLAFYIKIIDKLQDELKIHAPKPEKIPADDTQEADNQKESGSTVTVTFDEDGNEVVGKNLPF